MSIRKEEYTALGDFIQTSFTRDQPLIAERYPKMNVTYLTSFKTKLEQVKSLETKDVITAEQKSITKSLYDEADQLGKEMIFLRDYFNEAGIDVSLVSSLKRDIARYNIEGTVAKIESVI